MTTSLLSDSILIFQFPSNLNNLAFDSSIDFCITLNGVLVKNLILERINWVVVKLPSNIPLLSLGNVGQQLLRVHINGLRMVEFGNEKVIGDHFTPDPDVTNKRFYL
jgi:hypothetical protein